MITETPWRELATPATKLWKNTHTPEQLAKWPATLAQWLIFAPWMHPLWDWHAASLVHLRDVDGKPAVIDLPGATHEFVVFSMDPKHPPSSLDPEHYRFLSPVSIAQQFRAANDADALQLIEHALEDGVATARLSVDSDFRSAWSQILLDRLTFAGRKPATVS